LWGDTAIPEAIKISRRGGFGETSTQYGEDDKVKGMSESNLMADGSMRTIYYTIASDGSKHAEYSFKVWEISAYIYQLACDSG
jgi:hypothetical protein